MKIDPSAITQGCFYFIIIGWCLCMIVSVESPPNIAAVPQISTVEMEITESVVVDEPAIGDASEGFEFDGLVGIEPIYCWVTHYGPPQFHLDRNTSRCVTIRECLDLVDYYSDEWDVEIDGFCAVSPGMPWYGNHRDEMPTIIYVEGFGNYLVLDRKGENDCFGVDIYEPEQDGYMYRERGVRVWEVAHEKSDN